MLRRVLTALRVPLATWAFLTFVVVTLSHVSNRVLREDPYEWDRWWGLPFYLDGLVQYDGHRYLAIATDGYSYREGVQSPVAWFPGYPLLIRPVASLVGDPLVAGVLVTVVAGGAALVLYWQWLGLHGSDGPARLAGFALFALYPYAWFLYGTVYADAMFLFLALAACMLVERDHMVMGGLVGALATGCRPTGLALVPALLVLAASRHGVLGDRSSPIGSAVPRGRLRRAGRWLADWVRLPSSIEWERVRPATLAPLISLGGVLLYAGYLWWRFGDPLLFLTNQTTFHGRYPFLKATFFSRLVHVADTPILTGTVTLQASLALAVLLSAGMVARRHGFPYAVLVIASVAIPVMGTHDFMGTGRYLLLAFPSFAVAGERLASRPRTAGAVIVTSGLLMLVMAFGFSRSVYLS